MNRITFPLKLEMRGEKVADLQDALQLLLDRGFLFGDEDDSSEWSETLKAERADQTYGRTTGGLVRRFQDLNELQSSGEVDEPTARALNAALEEIGESGPDVEYQVRGRVSSRVSASVGGLRVVVVDKSVGGDTPLTEAKTDLRGHYEASFANADLRRRGKEKPDLQARVYSGERFLVASKVRYDASVQEKDLNVLLDENASRALRSEHETLTATLSTHYKGNLRDLQETDERQDITYLGNKTGWDARAVALSALADQFSARTAEDGANVGIEPPFFYALFRAGLPANEATLYRTQPKTVEGVWKQALEQGVIPAGLAERLPEALEQFQRMASRRLLEGPPLAGASNFDEILSLSIGEDTEKRHRIADLYTRHGDDLPGFWQEAERAFGEETAKRLKLDGQLAYLTLNNAPLIRKLHAAFGENRMRDTEQLVQHGFYHASAWKQTIGNDPVPPEIPGKDADEKREHYAELQAAQVRLSFPTAVLAQMVNSGETPVGSQPLREGVLAFLTEQGGDFEVGVEPVARYVARNNLQVDAEVTQEITRIQRVYQITPDDEAMNGLLNNNIDSAQTVARYDRDEFVRAFKGVVGGEQNARLVHAKAQQVHTAVLNVALTFLTARGAPGIGVHSPASIVDPMPSPPDNAADVLAFGTLENLFGEMDYCACEHCRSILSPAAYLVDLLLFLYSDDEQWASFLRVWKDDHADAPYPFVDQDERDKFRDDWNDAHPGDPLPNTEISPFNVLMSRRPDIQHLPLTCENTNIPLPYIDLVNETLEYYITNKLSLGDTDPNPNIDTEYFGHDTDGSVKPEELLANPQFVREEAYTALAGENFPPPLPFHQPLENLRRHFRRFEAPLPEVMEALRKDDSLERASDAEYGWRDVWIETLELSRAEHRLLTQSWPAGGATDVTLTVKRLYGFDQATPDADVRAVLDNARKFSRRVGITYEELVGILRTRFVNPNSHLIPRLERLGVPFATLKALKDGAISEAEFDDLVAPGLDPAQYGGDIKAWVRNDDNYNRIMSLLTLTNRDDPEDVCNFEKVELRYSNPDMGANKLRPLEFIRLIRFIRLWKKLGWSIEQTDKAITALYPATQTPNDANDAVNVERLDAGFLELLPRLGIVRRGMSLLKLRSERDLLPLLACFAPIDTHGESSLYRQMFLSPSRLDDAFAEDGYGNYLNDPAEKLVDHAETLRAAFSLTADEFSFIVAALGFVPVSTSVNYTHGQPVLAQSIINASGGNISYSDALRRLTYQGVFTTTVRDALTAVPEMTAEFQDAVDALYDAYRQALAPLTLDNISAVFRRGWLARSLKLSLREFLLLTRFTGYDPFEMPNPVAPAMVRFIELVDRLRTHGVKPTEVLYLVWNQDLSGKSTPTEAEITTFAHTLRSALTAIEGEFAVVDDPDGSIARARMALVYGNEVTDLFFGLLEKTFVTAVEYHHDQAKLEQPILDAAPGHIAYDDFRKRISYSGVLTTDARDALKGAPDVTQAFKDAVDKLYAENQKVVGPFFTRYAELLPLYEAFVFFGELKSTVSYTHTQPVLGQAIVDEAPDRIIYDHDRHELSFKGVLTATTREALKDVADAPMQFQTAVDNLFTANQAAIQGFFAGHPTLAPQEEAYVAANDDVEQMRSVLLEAFLPELKRRRKRQQALQSVSAAAEADIGLANALLENAAVLHAAGDAGRPALEDLTALEAPGLAARFFHGATATGNPDLTRDAEANLEYAASGTHELPPNTDAPGTAISGVWSGYLEAPENGFYNVRIDTDTTSAVTLTLNRAAIAMAQNGGAWSNTDPIELRAGTLYPVSLTVENVKNNLAVRWQTASATSPAGWGRGWEIIPAPYLYSATLVDNVRQAYVRFLKTAALAAALKLTAAEIAHFTADTNYHIGGEAWLNRLPATGSPDSATAVALLKAFDASLAFSRIKSEVSPGDERLLEVLRDPAAAMVDAESLLYVLTRWEKPSLDALLTRYGKTPADLAYVENLRRVYEAYGWAKKLDVPAEALIEATTNEPTADAAQRLQAALHARYEQSAWLEVLRPINDEMRSLQRDALVAYILHHMRSDPASEHLDTPEKLFEYFLMDVQMDPCMLTSRIRHALSSVQLFIERCLMSLEPRVSPASIKAKQWEWMKRYRVWEANRKVFIWPENWLEPELRHDQSPFFKEFMSELLQGDITEDRAAQALVGYLTKLDEVAKLEICGVHYEEKGESTADDVVHVIARTAGANRKYFYRRREPSGWTPWEKVSLDIEDNPVLPVVWKNRLFLFWLKLVHETKETPLPEVKEKKGKGKDEEDVLLAEVPASQVFPKEDSKPMIAVKAILNWSEFLGGKWQPTRTSDPAKPLLLDESGELDTVNDLRAKLRLAAMFWPSGEMPEEALRIIVTNFRAELVGTGPSFLLYNTFSTPELTTDLQYVHFSPKRTLNMSTESLRIAYWDSGEVKHPLLRNENESAEHTIDPQHPPVRGAPWDAPFFYEDSRHVFYVTTEAYWVSLSQWNDVGIGGMMRNESLGIPRSHRREREALKAVVEAVSQPGFGDPVPNDDRVTVDAYIEIPIGTPGTVPYGDKYIGRSGSQF